ncbi:diguanylate cyclase [Bifidobacterium sp.]|uniref:diguanylate cyclase n=1 Tax=Bifidobacterium sp. TaxID=41200 RepID=UPI0039EBA9A3
MGRRLETPMYDVNLSYEENYRRGPFGAYAQALQREDSNDRVLAGNREGESKLPSFLGFEVRKPFGIPAGPLLNSHFTDAAFRLGFDMCTYKTVRSRAWACNPFPNVLAVHAKTPTGFISAGSPETEAGLIADTRYEQPLSISNSFGVPSQDPDVWQPDMQLAMEHSGKGQLLIPSFQGSRTSDMSTAEYVDDHVTAAKLVMETGAKLLEMNTSCPNEGPGRLLCDNPDLVGEICESVKNEIGDVPLMIKLAYVPDDDTLKHMIDVTVGRGSVQGIVAINTISARLVDAQGRQALPGAGRDRSGVCGHAILQAGLEMVVRLSSIRRRGEYDFSIIGVGGVSDAGDYERYRSNGADAVQAATASMWNSKLAAEISR